MTTVRWDPDTFYWPPQDTQDPVFQDQSVQGLDGLYDPCFLLHLFSELTRPGDCHASVPVSRAQCLIAQLQCRGTQVLGITAGMGAISLTPHPHPFSSAIRAGPLQPFLGHCVTLVLQSQSGGL